MSRGLKLCALLAAFCTCCASAQAPPATTSSSAPASAPVADPAKAAALLRVARVELDKKDGAAKALPLLVEAAEADPSSLDVRFWKAKAHAAVGERDDSLRDLREVMRMAPLHGDGAAAAGFVRMATAEIARLCPCMGQWDALRKQLAKAYRELADKAGATTTGAAAIERLCLLAPDDEKVAAETKSAREELEKLLPSAPAKPDIEKARTQAQAAEALVKAGNAAEAAKMAAEACSLWRSPETLLVLAQASEATKELPLAAAAATEGLRLIERAPYKRQAELARTLGALLGRADPLHKQFDALDARLAQQAEDLASRAIAAKDPITAAEAAELVLAVLPDRSKAVDLLDRAHGRQRIDLPLVTAAADATRGLRCQPSGTLTKMACTGKTLDITGTTPADNADTCVYGVISLPSTMRVGRSIRWRWLMEPVSPAPGHLQAGNCKASVHGVSASWGNNFLRAALADVRIDYAFQADKDLLAALYREDGVYDLTFEKTDRRWALFVGRTCVLRLVMPEDQAQKIAQSKSQNILLGVFYPPAGSKCHLRATMLDLTVSPDCLTTAPK